MLLYSALLGSRELRVFGGLTVLSMLRGLFRKIPRKSGIRGHSVRHALLGTCSHQEKQAVIGTSALLCFFICKDAREKQAVIGTSALLCFFICKDAREKRVVLL